MRFTPAISALERLLEETPGLATARSATTSLCTTFMERVAVHVAVGRHVRRLQQYWLGLQQFRYTSWLVPVWWNDRRFTDTPVPFDAAFQRVAPDVILIDQRMDDDFDSLSMNRA
jgi:hypothetical protein